MMKLRMFSKETVFIILLFGVGLLTRIPFSGEMFYYWDCVNYALALEDYDLLANQPSAPGYFLYIMLGRLVHMFIAEPNACFVVISILASAVAISAMYVLGRDMFSRQVGLAAALLLLSSPVVWFHGEVAFAYALEGALTVLLALVCFRNLQHPSLVTAVTSACLLAFLGGVRPQGMVFLFPLWLFSQRRLRWLHILTAMISFGLFFLAWLIPMIVMTGGWDDTIQAFQRQSTVMTHAGLVQTLTSWLGHAEKYTRYLLKTLTVGIIALAAGVWILLKRCSWKELVKADHFWLMVLWIAGPSSFFIFVYLGNPGHTFTCLYAFILLAAVALSRMFSHDEVRFWRVTLGVVLVNVLVFFWPLHYDKPWRKKTWCQYADIYQKDTFLRDHVRYIEQNYDPKQTMIITDMGGSGHIPQLAYYLPQFRSYSFAGLRDRDHPQNVTFSKGDQRLGFMDFDPPFMLDPSIKHIIVMEPRSKKYLDQDRVPITKLRAGVYELYHIDRASYNEIHVDYKYWTLR